MDSGSSLNEINFGICLFNLEVNKTISSKTVLLSIHSVRSSLTLDSLSASMLKIPGISICFIDWAQSQISWTTKSISTETILPILFIAAMAEVLSI